MIRNRFRKLLALCAVCVSFTLLVGTGCGPSTPRNQNFNTALDTDTVVMLDKTIGTQLSRQNEWVETKNGFTEAHVILRNLGGRTLKVEVFTYFKDKHGGTIDLPMATWDAVTINPHEDFHYSKLCPKKTAKSYQFHVRLARAGK